MSDGDLERFWDKVIIRESSDCWEWSAGVDKNGYGQFQLNGFNLRANRISYAIKNGDPKELCVCHSCDNPSCVNPGHLWIGTMQDDMDDCVDKGRQAKGEDQGSSKLTEEQVQKIIASNELHRILARRYGVTRVTISRIKTGKSWRHRGGKFSGNLPHGNSQTKVRGVHPHKASGKYQATIKSKKVSYYLGLFDTVSEAEQAVISKRKELA
jgi:hypothetical protein